MGSSSSKPPSFKIDPKGSINKCNKMILKVSGYKTLDDFIVSQKDSLGVSKCQASWLDAGISIHCDTCSENEESVICLKCYLFGNHEGHNIKVKTNVCGNCDCGDCNFLKRSGFCQYHKGLEPEMNKLPPKLQVNIVNVFHWATSDLPFLAQNDPNGFVKVVDWLRKFVGINDEFRRYVVQAITGDGILNTLIQNSKTYEKSVILCVVDLFGACINDGLFSIEFSKVIHDNILDLLEAFYDSILKDYQIHKNLDELFRFSFHAFSNVITKDLPEDYDFLSFFVRLLKIIKKYSFMQSEGEISFLDTPNIIESTALNSFQEPAKKLLLKDKLNTFVDQMTDILLDTNYVTTTSIIEPSDDNVFMSNYLFDIKIIYLLQELKNYDSIKLNNVLSKYSNYFKSIYINNIIGDDKTITNASIFDGLRFTLNNHIYIELNYLFNSKKDNIFNIINDHFSKQDISLNDFLKYTSINLVRSFVALYYFQHRLLGNCFGLKKYLYFINIDNNSNSAQFSLLQYCAGYSNDKESFINSIANTFGVFKNDLETPVRNLAYFDFLYFISLLITNRNLIDQSFEEITKQKLITKLLFRPKKFDNLQKIMNEYSRTKTENDIKAFIDSFADKSNSLNGTLFKLKSVDLWDPLSPLQEVNKVLSVYTKFIAKYPNKLLPFKPFTNELYGMDLHSYLFTPTIYFIEYIVLLQDFPEPAKHLVLNLLILASSLSQKQENPEIKEPIKFDNIEEFCKNIPNDFKSLMYQPFIYQNNNPYSFRELIQELGDIGKDALKKINIDLEKETAQKVNVDKSKAKNLRADILKNFKVKLENFEVENELEDNTETEECVDSCNICQIIKENEILSYPVYKYYSHLPSEFDGNPDDAVICFSICLHLIHYDCLVDSCPIDRYRRNFFIPKIDNIKDYNDPSVINILNIFKGHLLENETNLSQLVKSISSLIVISEVRLRANQYCLDSEKYFRLARNLFLCTRALYKMGNELYDPNDNSFTTFQTFIINLIKSQEPKVDIVQLAIDALKPFTSEDDLVLFLRRVQLTESFCLYDYNPLAPYFDSEHLLSIKSFEEKFDISIKKQDIIFSPYEPFKLPYNFLDLSKTYLGYMTDNSSNEVFISLHDGIVIEGKENAFYYFACRKCDFTVFMSIGKDQSQLFLTYREDDIYLIIPIPSIYQNFLGIQDCGFKYQYPLYLSKEKYDKLFDELLSGEIVHYIEKIEIRPN